MQCHITHAATPRSARGPCQVPVARGERRVADQGGRQQVQIDPAEPLPHQPMAIDELQHLPVGGDGGRRELVEEREHFGPSRHLPAGELALDERMPQHQALGEPRHKGLMTPAAVIDPDGGIDQIIGAPAAAGGAGAASSSETGRPERRSRWALARAIKASRPAWISAVFSSHAS